MNNKSDQREFDRVLMEFVLEVSGEDITANKFNDKTILKDVSTAP